MKQIQRNSPNLLHDLQFGSEQTKSSLYLNAIKYLNMRRTPSQFIASAGKSNLEIPHSCKGNRFPVLMDIRPKVATDA